MSKECDTVYAEAGRRSIPPERLLRAVSLQIFCSIRSETTMRVCLVVDHQQRSCSVLQTAL